jgi:hypothetical protein
VQAVGDALDRFVDAAVDAQRQAVAGIGDGLADLVEILGTPADDVQDRPEDFAFEPRDAVDFVGARREEGAVAGRFLVERAGEDRRRKAVEPARMRLRARRAPPRR